MRIHTRRARAASLAFAACAACAMSTASAQVVISQTYSAGGGAGSTFTNHYVELFNRGSTPVSLSGKSLQSATAAGAFNTLVPLPHATINPGHYFLVQLSGGFTGAPVPMPDAFGAMNLPGGSGKVALVTGTTLLDCGSSSTPCTPAQLAQIDDLLGYGSATFAETTPVGQLGPATAALRADAGCRDTGDNSADFTVSAPNPRTSATQLAPCASGPTTRIFITDASVQEGNDGPTMVDFTIALDRPAPPGDIRVQWGTEGITATDGVDITNVAGTLRFSEGQRYATVRGWVNGDIAVEPDETFRMTLFQVFGANPAILARAGIGTIIDDDDQPRMTIAQVQGTGLSSPALGGLAVVEGIVTARRSDDGFYLQMSDAESDGSALTSDGIFVFTGSTPPVEATPGNRLRVTGTVEEYQDVERYGLQSVTRLVQTQPVVLLATNQPLPTPRWLTTTHFSPGATMDMAERFEGMRVTTPVSRAVSPSGGKIDAATAEVTPDGVFHVVFQGIQRPFREPGVSLFSPAYVMYDTIPRFDTNQERLMVRSAGQDGATAFNVDADATLAAMTGVLDYHDGTWALLPDVGGVSGSSGRSPAPVSAATANEVRIANLNLGGLNDEIDDGNGVEPMTAAGLQIRLAKITDAVCDYLRSPDIIGVSNVENLRVLGLLADRIAQDCGAAPHYTPYLERGNDATGAVGFLVNTRVYGMVPRVVVQDVVQEGLAEMQEHPFGPATLLHDRPPLRLRAVINAANGKTFPVTVVATQTVSRAGTESEEPGSQGYPTEGVRARTHRIAQAEFLASLVDARQIANPLENIVLLGDFDAFAFNDGVVDLMGIVTGREVLSPMLVMQHSGHVVGTPLTTMTTTVPAAERYSSVDRGSAQAVDHIVANQALINAVPALRLEHARINADFGVDNYGDDQLPLRMSDRDPAVLVLPMSPPSTDLGVQVNAVDMHVAAGADLRWRVVVANPGPDAASDVLLTLRVPATLAGLQVQPPAGVSCVATGPVAGSDGFDCATASLGAGRLEFLVTAPGNAAYAGQAFPLTAEVLSNTVDPMPRNHAAEDVVTVQPPQLQGADLRLTLSLSPDGVVEAEETLVQFTLQNNGPSAADVPMVMIAVNGGASVTATAEAPAGWTCTGTSTIQCQFAGPFANRRADAIGIRLRSTSPATVSVSAIAAAGTPDPHPRGSQAAVTVRFDPPQ